MLGPGHYDGRRAQGGAAGADESVRRASTLVALRGRRDRTTLGYAHTEGVGREVAACDQNAGHFLVEDPTFDYTGQINHWKVVYSLKAIVELSHVFVPGRTGNLYPDWQERWHSFVEVNGSRLTPDFVAAFLVMDEPLLRGLSWAQTAELAPTVKRTLPDIATSIVENAELVEQLPSSLPPELDWVGLDSYGIRNPAQDPRYLAQLDSLQSRMLPAQRVVVVGDGCSGRYTPLPALNRVTWQTSLGATSSWRCSVMPWL